AEDQPAVHHGEEDRHLAVERIRDLFAHRGDAAFEFGAIEQQLGRLERVGQCGTSVHVVDSLAVSSAVTRAANAARCGLVANDAQVAPMRPRNISMRSAAHGAEPRIAASEAGTISGLQTRIRSQPASRCASMRASMPPALSAAAMLMSSLKTT